MKVSIVIPLYNERATLETLLHRVLESSAALDREVIVVDDCSRDGSWEELQRVRDRVGDPPLRIFRHEHNQGKGAAVRTGFSHIQGDVAIVQDADLEYDPREYPRLLEPILEGRADVVYGSRFLGGPHRVLLFWHYMGNRFLTFICNLLYNVNLTDMETCYKVLRREVVDRIQLKCERFGFDPEITAKVCKLGCRLYEVPISYHGRSYAEGKKITWKDGFTVLWTLLRFRFND